MPNKVFVSPGVYTSEKDLSFVTKSVGVTTLGLVGETTKGPAFQPIFVQDYGEFTSFFGGLDASKNKDTGAPRFELPYVAKSYLSQTNQLFVTRVLGLSGYEAGRSWAITAKAAVDTSTETLVSNNTYSPLFTFTADSTNTIIGLTSSDSRLQNLYNLGLLDDDLVGLSTSSVGSLANIDTIYIGNGTTYSGVSVTDLRLNSISTTTLPSVITTPFISNQSNIIINDNANATPYPVTFTVSGLINNILGISLKLNNITHAQFGDVGITLVSPTGTYYTPIIRQEGFGPATNLVVTFSNTGSTFWDGSTSNGTYINDASAFGSTYAFGAPASITFSAGTVYQDMTTFVGLTPAQANGTWKLYIKDFAPGDVGTIQNATLSIRHDVGVQTVTTGSTSGITHYYTASSFAGVDDKVIALLRSRAAYDGNESLSFEVTGGTTPIGFSSAAIDAEIDPKGDFALTGTSLVSGAFKYDLSFDKTKNNYITKVLGRGAQDGKTAVFVEEIFSEMFADYVADGKISGINLSLVQYSTKFKKYKEAYQPAVTPWVVSELRGSNLFRLFRFWTISDGDTANKLFKISITNVKLDDKEFDLEIRNFYDTDASKSVFEKYTKLSMDPASSNYIAKKIGTLNGDFASKSNYVLVEMEEGTNTFDAFPAGFVGYPIRKYEDTAVGTAVSPTITYKKNYVGVQSNTQKRKIYQGVSDTVGIEEDFFTYKGVPDSTTLNQWTGMTKGFHMDVNATGATIDNVKISLGNGNYYSPIFEFETGNDDFRTEAGVQGGEYEQIYARKFTFAPYGGFDGWDVYRTSRTNGDKFIRTGTKGILGVTKENFKTVSLSNGDTGINSDYYAYLEAIWTFRNPEAVNINVFATPGIDLFNHGNLSEATIEMVEVDRADSLYIANIPDIDAAGDVMTVDNVALTLDGTFDSNYTATYWPWVQVDDTENNVYVYMPPTRDVVRNIALTDNVAFPWFAVAGIQRGDVSCIKARVKLTQEDRDTLYESRINPVTTFASDGVKIWGNKTLQVKDTALNRINVRRLLLQARKLISAVSIRLLFEQNDSVVRNQFLTLVNPILDNIRANRGLTDFRVVLDDTPESIDRGELVGRIFLKPTRALEFITLEFNIMNTGASFDNI